MLTTMPPMPACKYYTFFLKDCIPKSGMSTSIIQTGHKTALNFNKGVPHSNVTTIQPHTITKKARPNQVLATFVIPLISALSSYMILPLSHK
jgi:hypothetical protein